MQKKINVVHLIPGVPFGGGAESVLCDLCRDADKERFNISVLYWNERDELAAPMREAGARVVRLRLKKIISVPSVRVIASALKEHDADILHTHFMDGDFLGFWASRVARVPVVSHIHSYPFPSFKRHAIRYRLMARGVRRFICVSDFVRKYFLSMTRIPPEKAVVVRNGIDRARFEAHQTRSAREELRRSLGFDKNDIIVGNVSRILAEKGHDVFLKAALMILTRRQGVRFLIVGDGEARCAAEELARKLGIAEQVVFTGTRHDVPELLGIMDVFVFPAVNEAFGLCVAEAMAAGRPIAAAHAAAVPEVLRDGIDGLLFPPGDERALARVVLKLLDEQATAGIFAANALRRSQDFTSRVMARHVERVYTEVLGRA